VAVNVAEPPVQIVGELTVIAGPGVTVTTLEEVTWLPHASVTIEYSVTLPAVGKTIDALAPDPTEGVPDGLKLQLYVYPGTPYCPVVEAVIAPPAQTVVAESVMGVATFVYAIVCPVMVIVQGDPAPMQAFPQPVPPQQER
jgi:hypothetical protein